MIFLYIFNKYECKINAIIHHMTSSASPAVLVHLKITIIIIISFSSPWSSCYACTPQDNSMVH